MWRYDRYVMCAVLVAIVVRLTRVGDAALWLDEIATARWVTLPWRDMIQTIFFGDYGGDHLPIYFMALKPWVAVASASALSLRLPSVFFSCIVVVLVAQIASTLVDQRAARWAAWFAALSPFLVHHAQEARMYSLVTALAAVSILLLARFVVGLSGSLGFWFVVVNTALLGTHYDAVFLVGAEVLILLAVGPGSWLLASVVISLIALGQITMGLLIPNTVGGGLYHLGVFALPGVLWSMLSGYALLPSSEDLHAQGIRSALPYLPFATAAAVPMAIAAVAGIRSMTSKARLIILMTVSCAVLGPFVAHLILDIGINPRYASAAAPAFFVLLAAGSAQTVGRGVLTSARVALLFIMSVGLGLHLAYPGHGREDVKAAGRWLDANVGEQEPIVVTSTEMAELASFHWPKRRFRLYPGDIVTVDRNNAGALTREFPFVGTNRTIYMVGRSWVSDPDGLLQRELAKRYTACPGTEVRGIRVLCFVRPNESGN